MHLRELGDALERRVDDLPGGTPEIGLAEHRATPVDGMPTERIPLVVRDGARLPRHEEQA
ncbi:hypothetical protein IOD16_22445 [Saccharothrix sp. 6-C]|uniref:hypothetical protein n=1 Tax=Saccharothrix sp. 6-C TaxID=2781735 RepID=UPI0019175BAE|nr:hypothetical protein [Saccharothrix sp. 6-C]QQQ73988.1 hypothetical protein IOD16_22445 [Saccharothrix sp. 6-C]